MQLSAVAEALDAPLVGDDVEFEGVGIDTRTLPAKALFVGIRGEHVDGNDLLPQASVAGASAALLERRPPPLLPYVLVADTRRALGDLARHWRQRFDLPVIAITGSNGKTTVKEMCAAILCQRLQVLASEGNYNNDIGLPLTMFKLGAGYQACVFEMGANHAGEIARLTRIAQPQIAIITLCAPAHLEGFGSVDGVAYAKAEIFQGLPANGTAVINGEDRYAALWAERAAPARRVTFGIDGAFDVTATRLRMEAAAQRSRFKLRLPAREDATSCCFEDATSCCSEVEVVLPLAGRHNVMNALAAAAGTWALGIEPEVIAAGLAGLRPIKGRLQVKQAANGARVIDDTYNANPGSLRAALAVLAEHSGPRWLVLGDMGELGPEARALHHQAGRDARRTGIEHLVGIGPLSGAACEGFGSGAEHFDSVDAAARHLRAVTDSGSTLLVKASRAMRLEALVAQLVGEAAPPC